MHPLPPFTPAFHSRFIFLFIRSFFSLCHPSILPFGFSHLFFIGDVLHICFNLDSNRLREVKNNGKLNDTVT
jgi:hypothetical protein